MKKVISLIAAMLATVALAGAAYAMPVANSWTLDLSAYGSGTYTNIDHLDLSGSSTVVQHFSNPFNLQNGDTFTEDGLINISQYYTEPGGATDINSFSLGTGKRLYITLTGLTGSVSNVTATGFNYQFNPSVGSVQMFLDNDFNPANAGTVKLADLTLIAPSGGHNNGVLLGGAGINGTSDLTGIFSNVPTGVFFANGVDFGALPPGVIAFGLANTNNLLDSQSVVLPDEAVLVFRSGGQFNVTTVPEPGTMILLGAGMIGLIGLKRRRG